MSTRYTRNGDVELAYEDLGGAGGDPLLLIMGLGASRIWWPRGLVETLIARGFHVVAFDNRDAGESTHFPETEKVHPLVSLLRPRPAAYSVEDMTDDAVAVLDAVGWTSAHLFGASMGGLLVQCTALRHPGRVRSITAVGSMPAGAGVLQLLRYIRPGFLVKMSRMRFPEGRDGDIAAGMALARALASPGYPFDEAAARERVERDTVSGVRDTRAQARQTGAKWSGAGAAEVRVPALVVHGTADQIARPSAAVATAAAIDGARLVLLPGVGHDLPREIWPQVADEVRAVADRAGARRP